MFVIPMASAYDPTGIVVWDTGSTTPSLVDSRCIAETLFGFVQQQLPIAVPRLFPALQMSSTDLPFTVTFIGGKILPFPLSLSSGPRLA